LVALRYSSSFITISIHSVKAVVSYIAFLLLSLTCSGQITTPIIRAGFGIDADVLRSYFNNNPLAGSDDWFPANGADSGDDFVIDTSGAAAIVSGYTTNPASKFYSFTRGMRYPLLSTINGRIYYDAVYVRDFHGTDSTSFTGGSKNGQSPALWTTTTSPVLAKNDIGEGYLHVRRNGTTSNDSLWFFGAVSLLGTNGDRYFDFELYQTDITYNRQTRKFENYGPDAGHTSWRFDASGATTQVGDIIFTAEYGNTGLNYIEARIWVAKTAVTSVTPLAFSWTGSFDGDGAGATYGYAGIVPKAGGFFYQGLQNAAGTSAGPFGTIKSGDVYAAQYDPIQFMEFSVNLTKLGLDPMSFTTGSMCNLAFGKVLIKTRTSTSFTASITDFVSPFSFREVAQVNAVSDLPSVCDDFPVATISIVNPLPTSIYTWYTPNGHIHTINPYSIVVDSPGTYILIQTLLSGCAEGGRDTVIINRFDQYNCWPLATKLLHFNVRKSGAAALVNWRISTGSEVKEMHLERSVNGSSFKHLATVAPFVHPAEADYYQYTDSSIGKEPALYYRLKVIENSGRIYYSSVAILKNSTPVSLVLKLLPNPVKQGQSVNLFVIADKETTAIIRITDSYGRIHYRKEQLLRQGINNMVLPAPAIFSPGLYFVMLTNHSQSVTEKLLIQ
jgi:hypothetical protein